MPYRITWKNKHVIFEYFGAVSSKDILESNQIVYGDSRFDDIRWEMVLFDEAESIAFKLNDVRSIAYMDRAAAQSNRNITVAFVGENSILEEVENAYLQTGIQPVWEVVHCSSREEALKLVEKDTSS